MKKSLLAVMAALAMAGCSQNEINEIDNGSQKGKAEIQFGYSPVGRATVMVTDNFEYFKVSAYTHTETAYAANVATTDLIPGSQFNKKTVDGKTVWQESAGTTFYWPTSGYVTFFGYSPETITGYSKVDNAAPTLNYTVKDGIASQEDVLVVQDTKSAVNDRNTTVSLKFDHALTQVYFKLIGEDTELSYEVTSIAIKGLKNEGTYTYGSNSWDTSSATTTKDYTITLSADNVFTGVADPTKATDGQYKELTANDQLMILMPQTLEGVNIEVTYKANKGSVEVHSDKKAVSKALTGTWNPGDKMVYTLVLSGDKIKIAGEVGTDWTTKTPEATDPIYPNN